MTWDKSWLLCIHHQWFPCQIVGWCIWQSSSLRFQQKSSRNKLFVPHWKAQNYSCDVSSLLVSKIGGLWGQTSWGGTHQGVATREDCGEGRGNLQSIDLLHGCWKYQLSYCGRKSLQYFTWLSSDVWVSHWEPKWDIPILEQIPKWHASSKRQTCFQLSLNLQVNVLVLIGSISWILPWLRKHSLHTWLDERAW